MFGRGGTERRREWRTDQFTAEGVRNMGGFSGRRGKVLERRRMFDHGRLPLSQGGRVVGTGVAVPNGYSIYRMVGWMGITLEH